MRFLKPQRRNVLCCKVVLLIFNFGFFVAGLTVAIIGLWCLTGIGRDILVAITPSASSPALVHLAYGLTGTGGFVVAVVTLGTWSTLKENQCGLGIYLSCVSIVIVAEISLGILAVLYQAKATQEVSISMKMRLQQQYAVPDFEQFTIAIDYIQYQLFCCGIDTPLDWEESRWLQESLGGPDRVVPLTCCVLHSTAKAYLNPNPVNETACQHNDSGINSVARHQQGCVSRVRSWIRAETGIVTGVGIGVAVTQLAGLIAAAALCRALRNLKN